MNRDWWKEAVVYQIYPRSFKDTNGDGIGDLQGIISKLDYLQNLGIDVIWLSPVYASPNDDNGYDISDYKAIMNEFGTMDDFEQLLHEAHRRDLKIMMDLVVNHTSDEHAWFIDSKSSQHSQKRDFYIWKKPNGDKPPNNWESVFQGPAWKYDEGTGEYYLHLFSGKQPDLNWENPALRKEIYETMNWWIDKGIDGFRMDVINFISKDQNFPDGIVHDGKSFGDGSPYYMNGPRVHEFLQEMHKQVLSRKAIMTVGEMPGVNVEEAKLYTGVERNELQMVFHFEHVGLGDGQDGKWSDLPWKLTELKKIFTKWQEGLEDNGWNSLYWSNHDQPRAVSRFGNDHRDFREKSAKMLATCLHMLKGTPYIYQGEEIGMTNAAYANIDDYRDIETLNVYQEWHEHEDRDHAQLMKGIRVRSRDNARTPMQWNTEKHAGFTNANPWLKVNPNYYEINVENQVNEPDSIFHYYKRLIALRKQYEIIVYGRYELLQEDDENVYFYRRVYGEEQLYVACNFSDQAVECQWPDEMNPNEGKRLIGNYPEVDTNEESCKVLKPYEAVVYYFNHR